MFVLHIAPSQSQHSLNLQYVLQLRTLRHAFPPEATDSAGMVLDDACLVRYLRARKGNVADATAMLKATLTWRREFDVPKVCAL